MIANPANKRPPRELFGFGGHTPAVHESAWIAPTAVVIGQVKIGEGSSIWFHCVLRGDTNVITIGARTNIQDGTVIHVDPEDKFASIGDEVTVGHACILHGCRLEDRAFLGMGAIVLNGCVIEQGGMLAAGAVLTPGKRIARNELWTGVPARLHRSLPDKECAEHVDEAIG